MEQAAQQGCRDIQNTTGQGPEQPALGKTCSDQGACLILKCLAGLSNPVYNSNKFYFYCSHLTISAGLNETLNMYLEMCNNRIV